MHVVALHNVLIWLYFVVQGYAAREFANQGVKQGELAIISKEAVRYSTKFFVILCLVVKSIFVNIAK